MEIVVLWWESFRGVGFSFHALFILYTTLWARAMHKEDFALARTLATHTVLIGIIGTYVSLLLSLQVNIADGGLARFQSLLSLAPQSSLIGLSLGLIMQLVHRMHAEGDR